VVKDKLIGMGTLVRAGTGKAANCDPYFIGITVQEYKKNGEPPCMWFHSPIPLIHHFWIVHNISLRKKKYADGKDNEGEKAVKHTNAMWMRSIQSAVIGFDLKFSPPNAHPLPSPCIFPPLLFSSLLLYPYPLYINMVYYQPHHFCLHAKAFI
jgi:hypothetical protein